MSDMIIYGNDKITGQYAANKLIMRYLMYITQYICTICIYHLDGTRESYRRDVIKIIHYVSIT